MPREWTFSEPHTDFQRNQAEGEWRGFLGFVLVFTTCVDSPSITAIEYLVERLLGSVIVS